MKKCPQCNRVFDDSFVFCTDDRAPLVDEVFVLPSQLPPEDNEQETVIRHEPLNFNIPQTPPDQFGFPSQPPPVQPPPKQRNFGKYVMFLILGIVLGAGVVLALVVAGIYFFQRTATTNSDIVRTTPTPVVSSKSPPAPDPNGKHVKKTEKSDEDFNGRVIATIGRVRMLPNKTGTSVDVIPKNDRLNIEQRATRGSPWYRITCEHGTTGWIHGNEIEYTR